MSLSGHDDQRLSLLDDVGGELHPGAAADVLRRVDRSSRDEQNLARLERHRRLAVDLILQQAFDDLDDLFARMAVRGKCNPWGEINAHLNDLAPRGAEIVLLEISTLNSLLRLRRM